MDQNIIEKWEKVYKPQILNSPKFKIEVLAEILGFNSRVPVENRIKSGLYPFAIAIPGKKRADGTMQYVYEIYTLQFVTWYEGKMPFLHSGIA